MSALQEYRKEAADPMFITNDLGRPQEDMRFVRISVADAAIAEMEAELMRYKRMLDMDDHFATERGGRDPR